MRTLAAGVLAAIAGAASTAACAIVLIAGFGAFVPRSASAADVERLEGEVATPDQPEPRALTVYRVDGVDHLDLEEVAFLFRASRVFRADLGRVELTVADKTIALVAGSPFVEMEGSTANLQADVTWIDGRLVVPVRLLTHVLDPLVRERVSWSEKDRFLRLDKSDPNIAAITYMREGDATAVEVRTTRELPAIVSWSETKKGKEAVLKIPGGVLPEKLLGGLGGNGLVESLTTAQAPGSAALSFRLSSGARRIASAHHTAPTKIVLRFARGEDAGNSPPADTLGAFDDAGDPMFALWDRKFEIQRIVIDPGHGGSDVGGSSARGDREKDVALAISRRVQGAIRDRAPGLEVRLTREDDRFLTNEERRGFANEEGADLFLSIHCDGWFDEKRRGFTIMTYGRRSTDEGWSLPASAVRVEGGPRETERLAEAMVRSMDRALSVPNRGIAVAELQVLEELTMPGLLIECGTLTNAEDRKLLTSDSFQEKLAAAIADGVLEYRETLGAPEDDPNSDDEEERDDEGREDDSREGDGTR